MTLPHSQTHQISYTTHSHIPTHFNSSTHTVVSFILILLLSIYLHFTLSYHLLTNTQHVYVCVSVCMSRFQSYFLMNSSFFRFVYFFLSSFICTLCVFCHKSNLVYRECLFVVLLVFFFSYFLFVFLTVYNELCLRCDVYYQYVLKFVYTYVCRCMKD